MRTALKATPTSNDDARLCVLNDRPIAKGRYVLYWMQQSQRTCFNHALEYGIEQANAMKLPLVVGFGLMDDYPEANARHYAFMLQGLRDVRENLAQRGIGFVVLHGHPAEVAVKLGRNAAMIVCDRGYLRHQRQWRNHVADHAACRVVEIESDAVVPVETASDRAEYAARTLRPKIHRHLDRFMIPLESVEPNKSSLHLIERGDLEPGDIDVSEPDKALSHLRLDRSVEPVAAFIGGENQAGKSLDAFLKERLDGYAQQRNAPAEEHTSRLGAYLHFGQISALWIALAVRDASAPLVDREAYLEELIVRRELAINFVYFTPNYDRYECLPDWARKTLDHHASDQREHIYTLEQLESADTHDPYWNAAQIQMNRTGYMHGYMRMYWGKKILEWTDSPRRAYQLTLHLNNKLFLCGRDPNAYANVGWIYGLHDRPWGPERKIFGLIRYMNDKGLERKFDMAAYVRRVHAQGS